MDQLILSDVLAYIDIQKSYVFYIMQKSWTVSSRTARVPATE